ncbi:MAG TPA: right-handed parallel beta-helix repeat-containing protein [Anaerolineales bacterium]
MNITIPLTLASLGRNILESKLLHTTAVLFLLVLAAGCGPVGGPFTVNSPGDAGDSHPGDGVCRTVAAATECTLRAALEEANTYAGTQTINFNLPAAATYIYPSSGLPKITGDVLIDGTTQPGFDGGKPVVHVDGSHLGAAVPATNGFQIEAGVNATIQALQILRFTQNGIENYGNLTLAHMEIAVNQIDGVDSYIASGLVTVTISDSTFFENVGTGVSGINTNFHLDSVDMSRNTGGGLRAIGGTLNLDHGTVNDNATINDGGGISLSMVNNPTISNTGVKGNTSGQKGGGLYLWNLPAAILMVQNSTFDGNYGYDGGGVYIDAGTAHLSASTLVANRAKHSGGGVFVNVNNDATLFVEAGSIIGKPGAGNISNSAPASFGLGGGIYNMKNLYIAETTIEANIGDGIYNDGGTIRIQNSTVRGNTGSGLESFISGSAVAIQITHSNFQSNKNAGIGAINANLTISEGTIRDNQESGIRMNGGSLTLTDSAVVANRTSNDGGGIAGYNLGAAVIQDTTISGNTAASSGGGLYLWGLEMGATLELYNVTVSSNRAGTTGGGLEAASGVVAVNNVTLTQNTAASAGGLHNAATVHVTNTILADNTGGNCGGTIASDGYNLDTAASCAFTGPGDLSGIPAVLGPLAANGGFSETHALLPGSPALETGNDATCLPADQRGIARPQGLHCDMGAFEAESPATATPPAVTSTLTPTLIPSKTPTPTSAPISFDPVNFSTDQLFTQKSCGPTQVTIQVRVSPPDLVSSLGLFYKLEEKEGSNSTPWSEGQAMIPQGGGWYQLILYGEDLPSIGKWKHDAWLDVQFVANGEDGKGIAWSTIYRQVTLGQCYF